MDFLLFNSINTQTQITPLNTNGKRKNETLRCNRMRRPRSSRPHLGQKTRNNKPIPFKRRNTNRAYPSRMARKPFFSKVYSFKRRRHQQTRYPSSSSLVDNGYTALIWCCIRNREEILDWLLEQEVALEVCDSDGFTALDHAIIQGHYKIALKLKRKVRNF